VAREKALIRYALVVNGKHIHAVESPNIEAARAKMEGWLSVRPYSLSLLRQWTAAKKPLTVVE